jgi:S-adenosylmethionine/arginine decarboxylase-like enzyme
LVVSRCRRSSPSRARRRAQLRTRDTRTVNVDIFSCTPRLKTLDAIAELSQRFGAQRMSVHEISRTGDAPSPAAGA